MSSRRRILFFGEAVTLAHVTRPLKLANYVDRSRYEVHFACAPRYRSLVEPDVDRFWDLHSIESERFLKALAQGRSVYDLKTLERYVEDDDRVIGEVRPDLIVGDFRLSLAVSARMSRVPYASICNAHWSPYADPKYSAPDHPLARLAGSRAANAIFGVVRPMAFRLQAVPLARLHKRFGLTPPRGLCEAYVRGDWILYADTPEFIPLRRLPINHVHIGPVVWSPSAPRPSWWSQLDPRVPTVYMCLGSSGNVGLLRNILGELAGLPIQVLVATAGRLKIRQAPANVFVSDYLPGIDAARLSCAVICNGGSAAAYQALSVGTPVIGVPSNLDQVLTMSFVERTGAGVAIRPGGRPAKPVTHALRRVLQEDTWRRAAERIGRSFSACCPDTRFPDWLRRALPAGEAKSLSERKSGGTRGIVAHAPIGVPPTLDRLRDAGARHRLRHD